MNVLRPTSALLTAALTACTWGAGAPHAQASPPTSATQDAASGYGVQLTTSPCCVDAGRENTLTLSITSADRQAVTSFEPLHGMPMHLIAVSRELSWFTHVHPKAGPDGSFTLAQTFPSAGEHLLFVEFQPAGAAAKTVRVPLEVKGDAKEAAPLTPDAGRPKRVDGYEVRLDTGGPLVAGTPTTLTYSVSHQGAPVADFEPYLGAAGHLIVIDSAAESMQHVHTGDASGHEAGHDAEHGHADHSGHARTPRGPLQFTPTFGAAGVYKVWAEFRHGERVITVPFVVEVAAP